LFISSSDASAAASIMLARHCFGHGLTMSAGISSWILELHALGGLVPDDRLHLQQIDDAA
jgi:hypothetical protein